MQDDGQSAGRPDLEPQILDEATAEIRRQYLDCTKARDLIDWSPGHTLNDGLSATIEWYAEWLSTRAASSAAGRRNARS